MRTLSCDYEQSSLATSRAAYRMSSWCSTCFCLRAMSACRRLFFSSNNSVCSALYCSNSSLCSTEKNFISWSLSHMLSLSLTCCRANWMAPARRRFRPANVGTLDARATGSSGMRLVSGACPRVLDGVGAAAGSVTLASTAGSAIAGTVYSTNLRQVFMGSRTSEFQTRFDHRQDIVRDLMMGMEKR